MKPLLLKVSIVFLGGMMSSAALAEVTTTEISPSNSGYYERIEDHHAGWDPNYEGRRGRRWEHGPRWRRDYEPRWPREHRRHWWPERRHYYPRHRRHGYITPIYSPTMGGYAVDFCLSTGWRCGQPAADQYCRNQGYREAAGFTESRGYRYVAKYADSGRYCNHQCRTFSRIDCVG